MNTHAKTYRLRRSETEGKTLPPSPLHEWGGLVLHLWGILLSQDDLLNFAELMGTGEPLSIVLRDFASIIGYNPEVSVCPVCDSEFVPVNERQVYCCDAHKVSAQNERHYYRNLEARRESAKQYQRKKRRERKNRD